MVSTPSPSSLRPPGQCKPQRCTTASPPSRPDRPSRLVHTLLPPHTPLRGGGGGEVWTTRDGLAGRDGGDAVVHRRGLHRPGGRRDDGGGGKGDQTKAAGSGAAGGLRLIAFTTISIVPAAAGAM